MLACALPCGPGVSSDSTESSGQRAADQSACFPVKDGGEMEFAGSPSGGFHQCVMLSSVKQCFGFEASTYLLLPKGSYAGVKSQPPVALAKL